MTQEEKQAQPIVGGMHQLIKQAAPVETMPSAEVEDLPF